MQIVAVVGGKGSYWVQWCFQNLVKTQRGFYGVHGIRDNLGSDFNDSRLLLSAVKGDVIVVWLDFFSAGLTLGGGVCQAKVSVKSTRD
jgi:hypothetical protein